MNRQIKRTLGTVAALSLGFAGLVGASAPANAAAASTTFKIHLNVPKSVAQDWNLWYWNTGSADVGPKDNTIGESTQGGVTQDWTPNFTGEDAYGAYAEFTLPVALTALNNVMRTTESWDGQAAAPAVADDPTTPDVDETVAAKPEIPAADKPFGGDNIFPAGESWWNVDTQKREYPLKDVVSYKVHVNTTLKLAQSQGWNFYSWNTTVNAPVLSTYVVAGTKKVGKKTVATKTYPYKGKVQAATTGWPFVGEDKYGAFAIVKTARVYAGSTGLVLRRSSSTNDWPGVQSPDYKADASNGLPLNGTDLYVAFGTAEVKYSAPTFVGRYGATATYSNGTLTVTPVRPATSRMAGIFPTKIVVTAKKGGTTKTCMISNSATSPAYGDAHWALPTSCDMAVAAPAAGEDPQTWEIFVNASASGVGTALLGPNPAKKITIQPAG
jgi:hypothetical protein